MKQFAMITNQLKVIHNIRGEFLCMYFTCAMYRNEFSKYHIRSNFQMNKFTKIVGWQVLCKIASSTCIIWISQRILCSFVYSGIHHSWTPCTYIRLFGIVFWVKTSVSMDHHSLVRLHQYSDYSLPSLMVLFARNILAAPLIFNKYEIIFLNSFRNFHTLNHQKVITYTVQVVSRCVHTCTCA